MRLPRFDYPLPPRQRGVFGLMAVGLMLLMVISVALAVDTGRLFLEQRHMQRVADLAALEAAGAEPLISRASDGKLAEAAREAAKSNGHDDDDTKRTLNVAGGGVCRAPEGDGWVRIFFPLDYGEPSEPCGEGYEGTLERHAVEVTASHQVRPSLFASLLGEDEITISATAMAQRSHAEQYAVFSVGSRLLSLDTDESVLSPLLSDLGLNVSTGLAGLGDIANVNVMLGRILSVNSLGVGSVDQLLDAEVTLLNVVEAARLGLAGDDTVSLKVLDDLLDATIGGLKIPLGELLHVSTDNVPLAAEINLLELVSAGLFFANKDSAISLKELDLEIPGITGLEVMINVIEPPKIAIGPAGCQDGNPPIPPEEVCDGKWRTTARTEQLSIGVSGDFNVPLLADIRVLLGISAARAEAGIDNLWPGDMESHDWVVRVSAAQQPVSADVRLSANVLNTRVSEDPGTGFSRDGFSGGILTPLGIDSESSVVASFADEVLGAISNLVTGLLKFVVDSVYKKEFRLDPSDATKIQTRSCVLVTLICGSWSFHKNVPTLPEEVGSGGTLDDDESPDFPGVFEGLEAGAQPAPMTPPYRDLKWPSQDDSHPAAEFSGSPMALADSLSSSLTSVDLEVSLLGSGDLTSPLVSPIINLLGDIIELALRDLIAAEVLDPLLELLGIKTQEAEVRIIHIDHHTGPPELL